MSIFKIAHSDDGVEWKAEEEALDNSWWAIRRAREQSKGCYKQVTNVELNAVVVTFFNGMPISTTAS